MNARAHRTAGCLAGAGVAVATGNGVDILEKLVEAFAGAGGGALGAKFPDWAEPAVSSWHRGPVHSVALASTSAIAVKNGISTLEQSVGQRLAVLRLARTQAVTVEEANRLTLEILFWIAFVAFCKGVAAGYLSHVALDATTPRSIPLF